MCDPPKRVVLGNLGELNWFSAMAALAEIAKIPENFQPAYIRKSLKPAYIALSAHLALLFITRGGMSYIYAVEAVGGKSDFGFFSKSS
jgi:hypothetical protein